MSIKIYDKRDEVDFDIMNSRFGIVMSLVLHPMV